MRDRSEADSAHRFPRLAVLALLALAAGAVAPSGQARPAAKPVPVTAVWGKSPVIVFGVASSSGGIWTISPTGTDLHRLTAAGGNSLAVSPDGKTLLFGSNASLFSVGIADGKLLPLGAGYEPVWSPDGKRIAFIRDDGVYVMKANGTDVKKVVTNNYPEFAGPPTWSPDGSKLAYVACSAPYMTQPCEHQTGYDVYVIGVDGSEKHKVTPKPGAPACPAWSNVAKLAFLTTDNTVGIVRAGGGLRTFRPAGCPVWAPNGKRYAVTTPTGAGLMNFDGTARKLIVVLPGSHTTSRTVAWSGDGGWLAVVGGDPASHLYVVRADGSGVKELL